MSSLARLLGRQAAADMAESADQKITVDEQSNPQ
jgi:hypothetical protein